MANLAQVTKILMALWSTYPNPRELTEIDFNVYAYQLKDLDRDVLQLAADAHCCTVRFPPSVAELRDWAVKLQERANGVLTPYEAWAEVERSFRTHGLYKGPPEWSHPLIGETIKTLGSYADLCRSTNHVADRAHFLRAYEALLEKYREEQRLPPHIRDAIRRLKDGKLDPEEDPDQ
jgi:hypothetical protein